MKEKYDVVIIGAGIGGLVCGCYLAKAGLKVLIVEKNDKPGGYCSSFEREGYRFDAGAHYLGGIKRGILGKILEELELKKQIKFTHFDPTDKIIMPDTIIYIRANPYDTIKELKKRFPKERLNIEKFFKFMIEENFLDIYNKVKLLTCRDILEKFFKDDKLKSIIKILLINTFSVFNPDEVSAVALATLMREFILDPGYYPIGGLQKFPDTLMNSFKSYGGNIMLSKKVIKIITKDNKVKSVILQDKKEIETDILVSNIDTTTTFKELLDIELPEVKIVEKMKPSSSAFMVYLGLNQNIMGDAKYNIWYFGTYNMKNIPSLLEKQLTGEKIFTLIISSPSIHTPNLSQNKIALELFSPAPYNSKEFWEKNREILSDVMIAKANEILSPFRKYIDVKITATPYTFYRYTSNREGAMIGWIPTIEQIKSSLLSQRTSLQGLFLVGHWCTIGTAQGGIPGVAFSGRQGAYLILGRMGIRKEFIRNQG